MPPIHSASEAESAHAGPPSREQAVGAPVVSLQALSTLPAPVRAQQALRLQRTAGNRAVARALSASVVRVLAREPPPLSEHAGSTYDPIVGQAFVQGAGDVGDIDANDVNQGLLGDCNLLAPLAAVARANPAKIRSLISAQSDGTYNVTLYYKDHFWSDRTAHTFNVTNRFYTDTSGTPIYARYGDTGASGPELWVMLIEKAFARSRGSYSSAGSALWDREGLELITGNTATEASVSSGTETELLTAISNALAAGDAVTVNTSTSLAQNWLTFAAEQAQIDALNIKINHAYSIESVDTTAMTLNLRNPWGYSHLTNLPVAAFRRYPFYTWSRVSPR